MLIGVFLNTILYGVLLVQTFIYFQTYKKDTPWIRYFVLYLFIVETLNTGFDIAMIYEPLITRYGTPRAVSVAPMMLSADAIVTVAISTPVQLFIAWRIWTIGKSIIITFIISFFAICSFVGGVATTVSVSLIPEYFRFGEFQWAVITWLASSAVADIVITVSLVWSLRNKRGFTATNDIINRIIRLSVQTGAITTISAIADIAGFLVFPHTTVNFIADLPLSKLYTNSLLSTLNARVGWHNLAGPQSGHNVLFGMQNSSEWRAATRTDLHVHTDLPNNRHRIATLPSKGDPITDDVHYLDNTISVTKVVDDCVDPIIRAS